MLFVVALVAADLQRCALVVVRCTRVRDLGGAAGGRQEESRWEAGGRQVGGRWEIGGEVTRRPAGGRCCSMCESGGATGGAARRK